MKRNDVIVEVRDKNFQRVGVVHPDTLDFELHDLYANVGTWKLTLPYGHPLNTYLLDESGRGGVVVSLNGEVIASGPVDKTSLAQTPEDTEGMFEHIGITDTVILRDALVFPDPAHYASGQAKEHDTRTNNAETLLHAYTSANIGPNAMPGRRNTKLFMGSNGDRGPSMTRKPRFWNLGSLLADIATVGKLGFRVIQADDDLLFDTYIQRDMSGFVRLDMRNGTLSGARIEEEAPTATHTVIGGSGEGVKREFISLTTPTAEAAGQEWGRRIEVYLDQRNSAPDINADDTPAEKAEKIAAAAKELTDTGEEALVEDGITRITSQVIPTDENDLTYGVHWRIGDKVSIVWGDREAKIVASGLHLKVDAEGAKLGISLGDPIMSGNMSDDLGLRLDDLELSLPDIPGGTWDDIDTIPDLALDIGNLNLQMNDLGLQMTSIGQFLGGLASNMEQMQDMLNQHHQAMIDAGLIPPDDPDDPGETGPAEITIDPIDITYYRNWKPPEAYPGDMDTGVVWGGAWTKEVLPGNEGSPEGVLMSGPDSYDSIEFQMSGDIGGPAYEVTGIEMHVIGDGGPARLRWQIIADPYDPDADGWYAGQTWQYGVNIEPPSYDFGVLRDGDMNMGMPAARLAQILDSEGVVTVRVWIAWDVEPSQFQVSELSVKLHAYRTGNPEIPPPE